MDPLSVSRSQNSFTSPDTPAGALPSLGDNPLCDIMELTCDLPPERAEGAEVSADRMGLSTSYGDPGRSPLFAGERDSKTPGR